MSEEQLKAAETDKVEAQVEDAVEEILEEDLNGVVGGAGFGIGNYQNINTALGCNYVE
jgi:hypothetical protein